MDAFDDIAQERVHQKAKGWTEAHDDEHETIDFLNFIDQRVTELTWGVELSRERRLLVEMAALTVAAIERLDRAAPLGGNQ